MQVFHGVNSELYGGKSHEKKTLKIPWKSSCDSFYLQLFLEADDRVANSHVDSVTPYPVWLKFYITAGLLQAYMIK